MSGIYWTTYDEKDFLNGLGNHVPNHTRRGSKKFLLERKIKCLENYIRATSKRRQFGFPIDFTACIELANKKIREAKAELFNENRSSQTSDNETRGTGYVCRFDEQRRAKAKSKKKCESSKKTKGCEG